MNDPPLRLSIGPAWILSAQNNLIRGCCGVPCGVTACSGTPASGTDFIPASTTSLSVTEMPIKKIRLPN
jgi:hypothetical protein